MLADSPQLHSDFLFGEDHQEDPFHLNADGIFGSYDPFIRLITETTGGWNGAFDYSLNHLGDTGHQEEQEVSSTKSEVGSFNQGAKAISYESLVSQSAYPLLALML